ncbi:MAG: HDIG domain-containing protein [Bacteroidaceae bacterium]|nr:HDIG domain-containing protein [Bacteroidaceae bacterium]
MSDITKKLKGGKLLTILSVLAVLLAVWFMPKNRSHNYDIAVGQPWTYGELIAPFDFSVEKSAEEYQAEIDSIEKNFIPYFRMNTATGADAIDRFTRMCQDSLRWYVSSGTISQIEKKLAQLYQNGIISAEGAEIAGRSKSQSIRINVGNTLRLTGIQNITTVKTAYQELSSVRMPDSDRFQLLRIKLEDFLEANLEYNQELSTQDLNSQKEQVSHYRGMVMSGQKIIDHGEIVTEQTSQAIRSYQSRMDEHDGSQKFKLLTLGGHTIFVSILYLILALFLAMYRKDIVDNVRKLLFLYGFIIAFTVFTCLYEIYTDWSIFIIPATMMPLMLRIFLDSRTAMHGYIVYVLTCSLFVSMPYEFVVLQLVAGMVAIYTMHELSQRSQIFTTAAAVFASYSFIWLAYQMLVLEHLRDMTWLLFVYFLVNSFVLLLTYPLVLAIEKMFGFISNVTLVELSNVNHPLLRRLSETAPGTFQHSMQVSTLAAQAASRLGANVQMVRTGALYHDIGKLANPPFFTENQNGVNPHDELGVFDSVNIITGHVSKGIELAEKFSLPEAIKGFIRTHHGNGTAKYFYIKYQNAHPEEQVDPARFSYSGPNPSTLEQAILMMADSTEAASRSLKEYTEESIGQLVDRIIDQQIQQGFFNDCEITLHQITVIKEVFKERLKTMYHTRIIYPEEKK